MKDFLGAGAFKAKVSCKTCRKAGTCKQINKEMRKIRKSDLNVWDTETMKRYEYARDELKHLGFAYPHGINACQLSRLSYFELIDLLQYIHSIRESETA